MNTQCFFHLDAFYHVMCSNLSEEVSLASQMYSIYNQHNNALEVEMFVIPFST